MANAKKFGVIGSPIEHSLSPLIHKAFAKEFNLEISYEKIYAPQDAFAEIVSKFFNHNGQGLNVTLPHKFNAFEFCDRHTSMAARLNCVNTIKIDEDKRLVGHNTDALGLIYDLEINHSITIEEKSILIIGAGGAASGILLPLLEKKPRSLTLTNRTMNNALKLINLFGLKNQINFIATDEMHTPFDLIINTSSAGLTNQTFNIPKQIITKNTVCYDLNYDPKSLRFLDFAREQNAFDCIDGWGMLVEQAAYSFEWWHGTRPDTSSVKHLKPS